MIEFVEYFKTEQEAKEFKTQYFRSYCSLGYGTTIDVREASPPLLIDGVEMHYAAHVSRFSSCD